MLNYAKPPLVQGLEESTDSRPAALTAEQVHAEPWKCRVS